MSYCTKCGKTLRTDADFCTYCGSKVIHGTSGYPVSNGSAGIKGSFSNNYLGFVAMGGLFLIVLLLVTTIGDILFLPVNLKNLLTQNVAYAAIAFAVVLTTRAKGPDMSLGAVMALSGIMFAQSAVASGSWIEGIAVALLTCVVIGIINGALTVYLRIPATVVTIGTTVIIRLVANALSKGLTIPVKHQFDLTIAAVLLLVLCFAAVFLLIFFSKLGDKLNARGGKIQPTNKYIIAIFAYSVAALAIGTMLSTGVIREFPTEMLLYGLGIVLIVLYVISLKSSRTNEERPVAYLLAYVASAVIGGAAGIYFSFRLEAATLLIAKNFDFFILFVYACSLSTRLIDNKYFAVVYALAPVLVTAMLNNILSIMAVKIFFQHMFFAIIALVFFVIAHIANNQKTSDLLNKKSLMM